LHFLERANNVIVVVAKVTSSVMEMRASASRVVEGLSADLAHLTWQS